MANEPTSLIDGAMPPQGMPLGGMGDEEIEVEEIEEPVDLSEEGDFDKLLEE